MSRKVIRSGDAAFVDERRVQPQPKLGAWRGSRNSGELGPAVASTLGTCGVPDLSEDLKPREVAPGLPFISPSRRLGELIHVSRSGKIPTPVMADELLFIHERLPQVAAFERLERAARIGP